MNFWREKIKSKRKMHLGPESLQTSSFIPFYLLLFYVAVAFIFIPRVPASLNFTQFMAERFSSFSTRDLLIVKPWSDVSWTFEVSHILIPCITQRHFILQLPVYHKTLALTYNELKIISSWVNCMNWMKCLHGNKRHVLFGMLYLLNQCCFECLSTDNSPTFIANCSNFYHNQQPMRPNKSPDTQSLKNVKIQPTQR